MEYRFTILIEALGAPDIAADSAEAMIDAFERKEPKAGAAVGANLRESTLEVTFSVDAGSLDAAWAEANRVFLSAAVASDLEPAPIIGVDFEPVFPRPSKTPLRPRRRGADAWNLPPLVRA